MSNPCEFQLTVEDLENVSITVNPLPVYIIEVAAVGVPGPTTYLGTLGGAGATASFVGSELLGGGNAYG